jgi:hypothetical protein
MEEFAQGVLTTCRLTNDVNRLLGDNSYAATCSAFRRAYVAVELIPRFGNITAAATLADHGIFKVLAGSSKKIAGIKATARITDLGSSQAYPSVTPGSVDVEAGTETVLTAALPAELLAPSNAKRRLDALALVEGVNRANRYTVCILTIYAMLSHDVGHVFL